MLKSIMLIIPVSSDGKNKNIFKKALDVLQEGGIVAYPTESFYALGVIATDPDALSRLFELKQRPPEKPLPVIVDSIESLNELVRSIPPEAESLMKKYWPGPLTLIFEAAEDIPAILTGSTGKIAVRIPGEGVALDLVKAVNIPVTATSANISSRPPAQSPQEVINYFGDSIDLLLDGGTAPGGKPSTIIDVTVTPFRVLRQGRVILEHEN